MLLSGGRVLRPAAEAPNNVTDFVFSNLVEKWSSLRLRSLYGTDSNQIKVSKIKANEPLKYSAPHQLLIPDDYTWVFSSITTDGTTVEKTNQFGAVVHTSHGVITQGVSAGDRELPNYLVEVQSGIFRLPGVEDSNLLVVTTDEAKHINMGYRGMSVLKFKDRQQDTIVASLQDGQLLYSGGAAAAGIILKVMLGTAVDIFFHVEDPTVLRTIVAAILGTQELLAFLINRPLKLVHSGSFSNWAEVLVGIHLPSAIPDVNLVVLDTQSLPPGKGRLVPTGAIFHDWLDIKQSVTIHSNRDSTLVWLAGSDINLTLTPNEQHIYYHDDVVSLGDNAKVYICRDLPLYGLPTGHKASFGNFLCVSIDLQISWAGVLLEPDRGVVLGDFTRGTLIKLFLVLRRLADHRKVLVWYNCTTYELEILISAVVAANFVGDVIVLSTHNLPLQVTLWGHAELKSKNEWSLVFDTTEIIKPHPWVSNLTPTTVPVQVFSSRPAESNYFVNLPENTIGRLLGLKYDVTADGTLGLSNPILMGDDCVMCFNENTAGLQEKVGLIASSLGRHRLPLNAFVGDRPKNYLKDLVFFKHGQELGPDTTTLPIAEGNTVSFTTRAHKVPTGWNGTYSAVSVPYHQMATAGEMLLGEPGAAAADSERAVAAALHAVYFDIHRSAPGDVMLDYFLTPSGEGVDGNWAALMSATCTLLEASAGVVVAIGLPPYGSLGSIPKEHVSLQSPNYKFFDSISKGLGWRTCQSDFFGGLIVVEELQFFTTKVSRDSAVFRKAYRVISVTKPAIDTPRVLTFRANNNNNNNNKVQLFTLPGCPLIVTTQGEFLRLTNWANYLVAGMVSNTVKPAHGQLLPSEFTALETHRAGLSRYLLGGFPAKVGFRVRPAEVTMAKYRLGVQRGKMAYRVLDLDVLKVGPPVDAPQYTITDQSLLDFQQCLCDDLSLVLRFPPQPAYMIWYYRHIVYNGDHSIAMRGTLVVRYFSSDVPRSVTLLVGLPAGRIFVVTGEASKKLLPYGRSGECARAEFFHNPTKSEELAFDGILYGATQSTTYGVILAALKRVDFLEVSVRDAPGLESVIMDMALTMAPLFGSIPKRLHIMGCAEGAEPTGNPLELQLLRLSDTPQTIKRIKLLDSRPGHLVSELMQNSTFRWIPSESTESFDATFDIREASDGTGVILGVLQGGGRNPRPIEEPLALMVANFSRYLDALEKISYRDPSGEFPDRVWFERLFLDYGGVEGVLLDLLQRSTTIYALTELEFNTLPLGQSRANGGDPTANSQLDPNSRASLQPTTTMVDQLLGALNLDRLLVLQNLKKAEAQLSGTYKCYVYDDIFKDRYFSYGTVTESPTTVRFTNNTYYGIRIRMDVNVFNVIVDVDSVQGVVNLRCQQSYEGIVKAIWFTQGLGGDELVFKPETSEQEALLAGALRLWFWTFPKDTLARTTFAHINVLGYSLKANFDRFIRLLTQPILTGGNLLPTRITFTVNKTRYPKKNFTVEPVELFSAGEFFSLKRRLLILNSFYWGNTFKYTARDNLGSNRWIGRASLVVTEDTTRLTTLQNLHHTRLEWRL